MATLVDDINRSGGFQYLPSTFKLSGNDEVITRPQTSGDAIRISHYAESVQYLAELFFGLSDAPFAGFALPHAREKPLTRIAVLTPKRVQGIASDELLGVYTAALRR